MSPSRACRRPRFAGRYYSPALPPDLERSAPGTSRLVLVPHGGEAACGSLLDLGLRALQATEECLLLGPLHDPPLGVVGLVGDDREAWEVLGRTLPLLPPPAGVPADADLQDQEHALEVVAAGLVRSGFSGRLLPLLMSDGRDREARLAAEEVIGDWLSERAGRVVVATTDLDHYHEAAAARRAYTALEEVLARGDPEAFLGGLEQGRFRPCGAGPVWLALALGRRQGWRLRVLGHGWSGDVPSAQVGFLAAAFEKE